MTKIEMMNELSRENRIIMVTALVAGILMVLGGLVSGSLPFVLGVMAGSLYSILNFKLIHLILKKAIKMPPNKAQSYVQTRYLMRYLLTGVVIYLAIIAPFFEVVGLIMGLLAIKLSILLCEVFVKERP